MVSEKKFRRLSICGRLKLCRGAVNWAKLQELQTEERSLFEANEEEYDLYEGMKQLFK